MPEQNGIIILQLKRLTQGADPYFGALQVNQQFCVFTSG